MSITDFRKKIRPKIERSLTDFLKESVETCATVCILCGHPHLPVLTFDNNYGLHHSCYDGHGLCHSCYK